MKIILPTLKEINFDLLRESYTPAQLLHEIQEELKQTLKGNFKTISDYYVVSPDVELLVRVDQQNERVYILDKKSYQEIRVEKMTSDEPQFDIRQYLRVEVEQQQTGDNKKRHKKAVQKQEDVIIKSQEDISQQPQQQLIVPTSYTDNSQWSYYGQQYFNQQPMFDVAKLCINPEDPLPVKKTRVPTNAQQSLQSTVNRSVISKLKEYINNQRLPTHVIAEQTGLNIQIIRLMQHEKTHSQAKVRRHPFKFLKPKYISARITQTIMKIPEDLRNFYVKNVLDHQHLTYEERAALHSEHRVTYQNLKIIYHQFEVPKDMYKEKHSQYKLIKQFSTDTQVQQLLAIELADAKIKKERILYMDIVTIQQTDFTLQICSYDAYCRQDLDPKSQYCWVIIAMDSIYGIMGYQILKERPESGQMTAFTVKLAEKLSLQDKVGGQACQSDDGEVSNCNWLVIKQAFINNNQTTTSAFEKGNIMLLPTFTDDHNIKLNAVSGFWQYLAQLWELKLNKSEIFSEGQQLIDSINNCLRETDSTCVKAIADSYNNQALLSLISLRSDSLDNLKDESVIHEKW